MSESLHKYSEFGKVYINEGHLTLHLMTHNGEQPYQCSQCDEAFTQKQDMIRHLSTHTDEKPYQCSQSGNAFSNNIHLISHLKTHTGENLINAAYVTKISRKRVILHLT